MPNHSKLRQIGRLVERLYRCTEGFDSTVRKQHTTFYYNKGTEEVAVRIDRYDKGDHTPSDSYIVNVEGYHRMLRKLLDLMSGSLTYEKRIGVKETIDDLYYLIQEFPKGVELFIHYSKEFGEWRSYQYGREESQDEREDDDNQEDPSSLRGKVGTVDDLEDEFLFVI